MLCGCVPQDSASVQNNAENSSIDKPSQSGDDRIAERQPGKIAEFSLDGESKRIVRELGESFRRTGKINHEDFQLLLKMQERYGEVEAIRGLMTQALIVRQDWDGLVEHHLSLPLEKRDHDQLAGAYLKGHRYQEAWDYLSEITSKNGTHPDRQWLLAVAGANAEREMEAERLLDELSSSESRQRRLAEIDLLRGQLKYRQTAWQEAEAHFRNALTSLPDDIGLHVNLGLVLRHLGQDDEAAFFENRARRLQQVADQQDATQRLMAALANNMEKAWQEKDLDRCLRIISQMEPNADSSLRRILDEYRREIAKLDP